jgi:protein-S-isoprenylcysteine O-methyltransferase Ste14
MGAPDTFSADNFWLIDHAAARRARRRFWWQAAALVALLLVAGLAAIGHASAAPDPSVQVACASFGLVLPGVASRDRAGRR